MAIDPELSGDDTPAGRGASANGERPESGDRRGRKAPVRTGSDLPRRRADQGLHYSRFVQGLRLILPVVTVILVLLVALWPEFNSIEDTIALSESPISLEMPSA